MNRSRLARQAALVSEQDERDWEDFNAEWPERMVRAADVAFAEYVHGHRSKRSFDDVAAEADRACRDQIPRITPNRMPGWFRKRLVRVLGPKGFKNLEFSSEWLVNAGTSRMWLPCIVGNQEALRFAQVFVVEPVRPWYLDRDGANELAAAAARKYLESVQAQGGAMYATAQRAVGTPIPRSGHPADPSAAALILEYVAKGNAAFETILLKLIGQPRALAAALRCRLELQRSAYHGWKYMRLAFVPYHIDEQPTQVEVSHEFRIH